MTHDLIGELLKVALLGSEWVLYLLLVLSVVSIGVMAERAWWFYRNGRGSRQLADGLRTALLKDSLDEAQKLLAQSSALEGRVLHRALRWLDGGPPAFADAVQSELARERDGLERGLNLLGTVGNNAPFVGLFGTVIGVIGAFHALGSTAGAAGAAGGMDSVMGAIAEALVATGVGLFVALPAVVVYNKAQAAIGDIEARTQGLTALFTAWLHTRAAGARPRGDT